MTGSAVAPADKRRIFIGDIQGCLEELERLLETVRFDPARDILEPVGDLVNRGPDSLGVLRLLRRLGAGGVLGNHDLHLLAVARGDRQARPGDTLGAVLGAEDRDALLAWVTAKPFCKAWPDVMLVHAGISPAWARPEAILTAPERSAREAAIAFATRVRWCDAEGLTPTPEADPPADPRFRPWDERVEGRFAETIVFGHWARRGLVWRKGFRGLDTGCVWGGRLSAWIAEEDRLVSVPAVKAWAAFAD